MKDNKSITLLLLEDGQVKTYVFTDKERILYGRKAPENEPDIPSGSLAVGREHGLFLRINDSWFYCDMGNINGSFIHGKKVNPGINGRMVPVLLNDGDSIKVLRDDDHFIPESMIVFMTGKREAEKWKSCKVLRKQVTFGNTKKDTIRIPLEGEKTGVLVLEKAKAGWIVTAHDKTITLNGKMLSPSQSTEIQPYDVLFVKGHYFIIMQDGLIYPETKDVEVNAGRFKMFG